MDRLGDTGPVHVDVRVIATTNRSLRRLVQEGKFRTDLFYRLNVVPLSIPPLRERREDIAQLAGHFIQKYKSKSCDSTVRISSELLVRFNQHDWQGNIRELENFIRRALALSNGSILGVDLWGEQDWMQTAAARDGLPTGISLRDMERQLLERTLESNAGNRTRAAEVLGVSLRTIRNKIREYGLPPRRAA